jgi:adenosylhomocysteine nucleosidase
MKELFQPQIGVVSAWRPELEALHSMIPNSTEVILPKEGITYFHGKAYGMNLVYLESGVGMTDSAISTADLLSRYPTVKYVMVAGVAGGLSPDIEVASVAVPSVWYDYSRQLYARPDGDGFKKPEHMGKFLQGSNFGFIHPMKTKPVLVSEFMVELARRNKEDASYKIDNITIGGHGLSASVFLDNPQYREFLHTIYPEAVIVDMESYAILRTCQRQGNSVEAMAIRTVSDTAGKQTAGKNELASELQKATDQLTLFLDTYLHLFSNSL